MFHPYEIKPYESRKGLSLGILNLLQESSDSLGVKEIASQLDEGTDRAGLQAVQQELRTMENLQLIRRVETSGPASSGTHGRQTLRYAITCHGRAHLGRITRGCEVQ